MIAIVLPTLNEAHNLRRLLPLIDFELGNNYKVIVIDDNSQDGTQDILKSMFYPIKLISRPRKMGYASAISAGIKEALKDNADIIVTMDADLSHNPIYIKQMIQEIDGYDVVIGSRYNKGGIKNTKIIRFLISRLGNYVAEKMLSLTVKDCTSGFRVYKSSVFSDSRLYKLKLVDGYGYLIMLTDMLVKHGLKVKEYPIVYEDRYNGKSKLSKWIILEALCIVMLLWFQKKMGK